MPAKNSLSINFLENFSARSKILAKRSWFVAALAGVIFFSMVIFFPILNLFGRGFYMEAVSYADNSTPDVVLTEQAHLPVNLTEVSTRRFNQADLNPSALPAFQPAKPELSKSASLSDKPAKPELSESASLSDKPAGRPMRLKIPKINVDAAVKYVGLTFSGAMDLPKDPDDVAWFELGPRPGENGNAIMAGHFGRWKNGQESVFNDLSKLEKGDKLYIEDDKGLIIAFVVSASRKYDPNTDASAVFDSNDGEPRLNLITCDGVWNKTLKSYSERLVVFADKVDSTISLAPGQTSLILK